MKDFFSELKSLRLLIIVWLLALGFSAVMFTIALIYSLMISIIISGITGFLSLVGIFYTASAIIKLQNHLKYLEFKANN